MLEERLSKAYSQHSIGGYSLPPPRQPPGPYPSMQHPTGPGAGPAENFYTADPRSDYNRTPTGGHPYTQQHSQAPPQVQYGNYDKRGSVSSTSQYPQAPQRTDSWQPQGPPGPVQYSTPANYAPAEVSPPTRRASTNAQPSRAPELSGPSAPDPNAAYYYNNAQHGTDPQAPPTGPSEAAPAPYPNLQQSMNYSQQSIPPTPASIPAQPSQTPHPQQYAPPGQHAQQPYWQQQQQQQQPQQQPQLTGQIPQPYQAPGPGYTGFSQDPFPSAPQHAPPQPVAEESLIDL